MRILLQNRGFQISLLAEHSAGVRRRLQKRLQPLTGTLFATFPQMLSIWFPKTIKTGSAFSELSRDLEVGNLGAKIWALRGHFEKLLLHEY